MLITNVEIHGKLTDVRIVGGAIGEICTGLKPKDGEPSVDGQGGALLPGLHDHHIHLNAAAAALNSVRCGPPDVHNETQLVDTLHSAPGSDWLRGIGYHRSVAGEIDRDWLDRNGPDRPIRIQHRGGRMWIFNSRAIEILDAQIPGDGRLVDGDALVRKALGSRRPNLTPLVSKLLSFGITGVTEVTPDNDIADVEHYAKHALPLRLAIMGSEDLHDRAQIDGAHIGPLKIHNHDHDLPSLADLTARIANSHDHDRAVAIHCVTRAEMMLSLAAIEEAGAHPGDRIEHGAIADEAIVDWIAKLGLTVVTQPHFISERQDAYRNEVDQSELPYLWPLKSFSNAGIRMAAGSDAPFGDVNPWTAMGSTTDRPDGFGEDEEVTPEQALQLYTKPPDQAGGSPRAIERGKPADLCLLDRRWSDARSNFSDINVRGTWIDGELVYDNISSTSPHSVAV